MKSFATFQQDMTQTIYENYLGILGVREIQVASQPRAKSIIPLIEKEYSQEKEYWDLGQDGNGKVQDWIWE